MNFLSTFFLLFISSLCLLSSVSCSGVITLSYFSDFGCLTPANITSPTNTFPGASDYLSNSYFYVSYGPSAGSPCATSPSSGVFPSPRVFGAAGSFNIQFSGSNVGTSADFQFFTDSQCTAGNYVSTFDYTSSNTTIVPVCMTVLTNGIAGINSVRMSYSGALATMGINVYTMVVAAALVIMTNLL